MSPDIPVNAALRAAADRIPTDSLPEGSPELVSVIIPTFNRADLVVEALDSVAAQTWAPVEIIVVDDGSTDHSRDALQIWKSAHPASVLRVVLQSNRGPAAARNAGVAAARGTFLHFLDSDDLIDPEALARLAEPLVAGPAPFSLGHIRSTDLAGRPCAHSVEGISCQTPDKFFASHWMTHAALYRRSTILAAGPFDDALRRGEDTEFHWRVLAVAGPGALIDSFIGVRRVHDRGHLCADQTARESARCGIATLGRFLDWADRKDLRNNKMCRSIFLRAAIAAVRAGHARDWAYHEEALTLLSRAGLALSGWRRLLVAPLRLRSRLVHTPLTLAVDVVKWLGNLPGSSGAAPAEARLGQAAHG